MKPTNELPEAFRPAKTVYVIARKINGEEDYLDALGGTVYTSFLRYAMKFKTRAAADEQRICGEMVKAVQL